MNGLILIFVFFFKEPSVNSGVFIDIDGVVLQGGKPFEWSREAIHVNICFFSSEASSILQKLGFKEF